MDIASLTKNTPHDSRAPATGPQDGACLHDEPTALAVALASQCQAERECASLRALLEQRNQLLAERDDLLQLLAHEVRRPLNNAAAALQSAAAALHTPGMHASVNADATARVQHADHVLRNVVSTLNNVVSAATVLVTSSHPCTGEVDLPALLDLVLLDLDAQQRRRVDVMRQCAARTVQLHAQLVRLALSNLLSNALAYAPQSPVMLHVFDTDEPLSIHFEVADQGQGIAAELLPELTQRVRPRLHARAVQGAGLGLYIVRRVVSLHDGTLEISANSPHGTRVRMSIPQGVGP